MQLPSDEQSVLAYFPSSEKAQEAAEAIKKAGLDTGPGSVQIDRVSRYSPSNDASFDNPIARGVSLAGLTAFSGQAGDLTDSERILIAADPSVSGIGDEGYGVAGGRSFLLTVVAPKDKTEEVLNIVRSHEGLT